MHEYIVYLYNCKVDDDDIPVVEIGDLHVMLHVHAYLYLIKYETVFCLTAEVVSISVQCTIINPIPYTGYTDMYDCEEWRTPQNITSMSQWP